MLHHYPHTHGRSPPALGELTQLLRNQLRAQYNIDAEKVFQVLSGHFGSKDLDAALPILFTWDTSRFVANGHVERVIDHFLSLPPSADTFKGLGQIASIILDKFAPFLDRVGSLALDNLAALTKDAQTLLASLLTSLGPVTLHVMSRYLDSPTAILLQDVRLLELMSALVTSLARRIIQGLCRDIDRAIGHDDLLEPILAALTVFPLSGEFA